MWWGQGHWIWASAMMIVFWGAVAAIVYLAFRRGGNDVERPSPRTILDERFANGEFTQREYERRRAALERRAPAGGTHEDQP